MLMCAPNAPNTQQGEDSGPLLSRVGNAECECAAMGSWDGDMGVVMAAVVVAP